MAILAPGLKDGVALSQIRAGVLFDFLGYSLSDMAKLGVISEERAESFNLPFYYPNLREVEEIVSRNGHFSIQRLNTIAHPMATLEKRDIKGPVRRARAVFEGILKDHFDIDEEITEKIFEYLVKKIEDNISVFDELSHQSYDLFVLLKRKID